jgi:oxygen-independent coproporphyrinogen III oxidase
MEHPPAPLSLYFHVPFCRNKCGYCDFYSIPLAGVESVSRYLEALVREINSADDSVPRAAMNPGQIRTIYIGGGTPSSLDDDALESLLRAASAAAGGAAPDEFTMEANPGSLDQAKARHVRRMGVNRLSLGIQSLNDDTLAVLGRRCDAQAARETVAAARRAGFDNLSLDLIFGAPGQTMADWLADVEAVLALGCEHLSVYGLSIEPQTPLGRRLAAGEITPVDDELYLDMMLAARRRLMAEGFEHYEISNYARPGRRSRHNMTYWRNLPYRGYGPAAASYIGGVRWKNVSDVDEYWRSLRAGRSVVAERERLGHEAAGRETAMLSLRLLEGLDLVEFGERTGLDGERLFGVAIERQCAAGMLECAGSRIRLTEAGLAVADSVLADFVVAG